MNEEVKNGMLDWDTEVSNDGALGAYIVLPEGDYKFTVTKFERIIWKGSAKIPAGAKCASYTLTVNTDDGEAVCRCDIPLHTSLEWKISAFFRSIGMKKHGEKIKPDWEGALNKEGMAHFAPREWTDGSGKKSNEVDYFLDYDEEAMKETFESVAEDIPF